MNFSDLFKQSSLLCEYSPNGQYIANVAQFRLVIRDVNSLQIIHLYTCLDTIQYIEWSPDSEFILCALNKRNIIQVFSIDNPEWKCKIDEGSAGLLNATWSPDSRHILTTSDFHLRITIWSLMNKSVSYMKYPKNIQKSYDFSNDAKYMLLVERRDCKDHLSIFSTENWQLIKHFESETDDLQLISWSPTCVSFCVLESSLEYKILIYNIDGQLISKYQPQNTTLGARCVGWTPSGQLLAVGGYDQKIKLFNYVTYKMILEFEHPTKISSQDLVIYKEIDGKNNKDLTTSVSINDDNNDDASSIFSSPSKYEIFTGSMQIAALKPDFDKPNPKIGVSCVQFSSDNRYMYTRNDTMPNILWIWTLVKFKLINVLIQKNPIKHVEWDPVAVRLAICSGNNKVYMWSPHGCISVEIPCEATFTIHSLKWNKDGSSIALISKDHFCLTYLTPNHNQNRIDANNDDNE